MKKILILIVFFLGLTITCLPVKAFDAGNGTKGDPYQIDSWSELDSIRGTASTTGVYYKLVADLASSTSDYEGYGDDWTPLGDDLNSFAGHFDGNGHNINDLIINRPNSQYVGLFGKTTSQSSISVLGMDNANVVGQELVGILVGNNGGKVARCYTTGQVSGRHKVGGLAGGNGGGNGVATIADSYSTALVSGSEIELGSLGGLVGAQSDLIINSYATGYISSDFPIRIGGLLGTNRDGDVISSFWNTETSGIMGRNHDTNNTGVGLTSIQMANQMTFDSVNWDFFATWQMSGGRPHLQWENIETGYEGPIDIYTCQQLQDIDLNLNGNYSLMTDIDCSTDTQPGGSLYNTGLGFEPIGDSLTPFSGKFFANGHKIRNLYINRPEEDWVGLFGSLSDQAMINGLGLIDVNITGGSSVGGLAGYSLAEISESYSTGNVSGDGAGGLVGINSGQLNNVYSLATSTGVSMSGGLVSDNNGEIINSYSAGQVFSSGLIGGLMAITRTATSVSNSFWDLETSGVTSSPAGVGLTTNQMKASSTFVGASWDFNNIWGIDGNPEKNNGYPYFLWQAPYILEYQAGSHGFINGPSVQRISGDISTDPVEAVPLDNFKFDSWSDGKENPERSDSGIYNNMTITANFVVDPNAVFTLNYSAGSGGIIVGSSTQSIIYNGSGSAVSASPNSGYRFVRWSDNSTSNPRTDTAVSQNITVNAIFEQIPSSSGGSNTLPAGIGTGAVDKIIDMGQTVDIGLIDEAGVNCLSYVSSTALFKLLNGGLPQDHQLIIDSLNMLSKEVGLIIKSDPITVKLKLGEVKYFDLNGDKTDDLMIKFANLDVNRIELTIKAQPVVATITTPTQVQPEEIKNDKQSTTEIIDLKTVIIPKLATKYIFKQNLFFGLAKTEVKELQKFLNSQGYLLAKSGPGSIGQETSFFGRLTRAALIRLQKAKNVQPATGFFGPITRGLVNSWK